MKLKKPIKEQVIGFVASMPFISWMLNYILYGEQLYNDWRISVVSIPLLFAIGTVSWYLHFLYSDFIRRKFPSLAQSGKRIFFLCFIFVVVMVPSILGILFLYDKLNIFGYKINIEDIRLFIIVGFCIDLIFESLWEVLYIVEKYKENLAEKEMLEQMNVTQEFEVLKSQVNPHFLFNCFNTLSSLISESKEEAEQFLDELSKVYRYLLKNNEAGVAKLESELKFIESYYRLLKTRHGDALQLQLEIDKKYNSYLLPSLSLQLLIENAVKHNVVSKQHPLMIEIFTTASNNLVVNNNLQPKLKKDSSTRIGLKNIDMKYKLLQQQGFQVVEGDKHFMVVMPLIWNNAV